MDSPQNEQHVPFFDSFIPRLSPKYIDEIYTKFIKSGDSLHYTVCLYLKRLCFQYFKQHGEILRAIYQPSHRDITMYRLGLDAPLSVISGVDLQRKTPNYFFVDLLLPAKPRLKESYTIGLNNLVSIFSTTLDSADQSTILAVFDSLLEKPLIKKEEYFLAGVEASKILYQQAVQEVNLRFGLS